MPLIYNGFIQIIQRLWTASLPLAGTRLRPCGNKTSAWATGLFLLICAQAQASDAATTQIEQSITAHIAQQVADRARQQGWLKVRHSLAISHMGSSEHLPACGRPLQVSADSAAEVGARQRLQVNCADSPGWSHSAMAQATIYLMTVHAATPVERGSTLHNSQLKLAETELGKSSRGFYQRLDEVSGQGAKRRIRAGQLITPNLLSAPLVIRRGEAVIIRASQDGISAATKGQALSNGRAGEVIRVRNLSSEKVIDAQVLEPGVVTSTFR